MQPLLLTLTLLGFVLPFSQFVPWLMKNGLNLPLLVQEAVATRISAFAWADVLVSALAVILLIVVEGRRSGVRGSWAAILGTLCVGPSFGLPLFLYLRERQRQPRQARRWEH
ncbi:DUF2834 domain-containing protein [Deinococcus sp. S9]|uniref:DUF2834 domain-containing protein n=1 Tax=Deinococcus sp. S9 TaxID=2545754 RepID=UPI001054A3F8|nr:DUF2834 domain-containing protein [Deinococcus sp. S9]TDE87263.1 DUF2834 domain-containing protein [Deinococcus sp. S9]